MIISLKCVTTNILENQKKKTSHQIFFFGEKLKKNANVKEKKNSQEKLKVKSDMNES